MTCRTPVLALAVGLAGAAAIARDKPSVEETTAIAKEATVHALPMLTKNGVIHEHAVDIDNLRAIQARDGAEPFSAFPGTPAPSAAPTIDGPKIDRDVAQQDPFGFLSFLLQFARPVEIFEDERPLRERFASVGIEPGAALPSRPLTETELAGMKAAAEIRKKTESLGKQVNGWQISEGLIGDRKMMGDNFPLRRRRRISRRPKTGR